MITFGTIDSYTKTYGIEGADGMALEARNAILDAMDVCDADEFPALVSELDEIDAWRAAFDAYLYGEVELSELVTMI